jgi:hypothetical protein
MSNKKWFPVDLPTHCLAWHVCRRRPRQNSHLDMSASWIPTRCLLPSEEKWSAIIHDEDGTKKKKISWNLRSELRQCGYYRTKYTTAFMRYEDCTVRFKITIWKDLGHGPNPRNGKHIFTLKDWRLLPQPIQFQGRENNLSLLREGWIRPKINLIVLIKGVWIL